MKIETWSFRFLGKPFAVPVHFHPSKGEFVATIPDDIAIQITGKHYESSQTSHDFVGLKKRIAEMINTREIQLIEKEVTVKVIAYDFSLGGDFSYHVNGRKREFYCRSHKDRRGSLHTLGITFEWRILMHSKIAGREQYRTENGHEEHIGNGEQVMEWSEDREAFFRGVESKIQALILQFDRFFCKQGRQKLKDAIDRGMGLALPSPETISKSEAGE